jgi:hypothetical protein
MLHSGWLDATKSGKAANYSARIAQQYQQQYKQDIRALNFYDKLLHP